MRVLAQVCLGIILVIIAAQLADAQQVPNTTTPQQEQLISIR
jgi:hypothetical protein